MFSVFHTAPTMNNNWMSYLTSIYRGNGENPQFANFNFVPSHNPHNLSAFFVPSGNPSTMPPRCSSWPLPTSVGGNSSYTQYALSPFVNNGPLSTSTAGRKPCVSEDEQWSWKTFLDSLPETVNSTVSGVIKNKLCPVNTEGSLVAKVIEKLEKSSIETEEEKIEAVQRAREQLEDVFEFCWVDFDQLTKLWKEYEKAKNIKSDRDHSGSTWTVDMLARYVKWEDVEFRPRGPNIDALFNQELFQKIFESIIMAMAGWGDQFTTEIDIRMVIDAILRTLCNHKYRNLKFKTERTLKCDSLPTSKPDYILYYDNVPIGVIEAKRPGSLIQKSVAQLILQLLSISAEDPNWTYFGLLHDSWSSVFIAVSKNKVLFFQEQSQRLELIRDSKDFVLALLWHIEDAIEKIDLVKRSQEDEVADVWAMKN